jgi:hypothetical protein
MTRQRAHRRPTATSGAPDRERPEDIVARLGSPPDQLTHGLDVADPASREQAMGGLQSGAGNAALGGLLGGIHRATGIGVGRGVASDTTEPSITREVADTDPEGPSDEVVPLDATAATNVTETVGPVAESSYRVTASSLADVAAVLGGRDEAGHVGWVPTLELHHTDGRIDSVTINVSIELEMPSWSPPSSMLPRAQAEWTRWYAALRAHEQGHIDLVHQLFDGLATRILGQPLRTGKQLFETAKTTLGGRSRAYDGRTGHGTKQGTVMDVSIEQQELDEERRKREAAEKAGKRDAAVPDVGDEGG